MRLIALTALLAALSSASAQDCTTVTQNVLTSNGCPSSCGSNPCVLFSPTQNDTCQQFESSGECFTDATFVVPGATAACTVTYQCLDHLVDAKKKWYLALVQSSLADVVTTAAVTEVKQLTYPSTGVVTIQVAGGLGRNARGDVKNVVLDDSFFTTPDTVVSFYLSELNLPTFIPKIDFDARKWTAVAFNNANLKEVPAGLGNLKLQYVELSKNFINNITDPTPFATVSTLNLSFNDLTDLPIALPAIVTLNLTGNPLGKIPAQIFTMTTLTALSMRQCNLSNVQLTTTEFAFLEGLRTLDADLTATSCGDGHVATALSSGAGSVCIPGTAPTDSNTTNGNSNSSNSTPIIIGVVAGVVVVALLAFFAYRRRARGKGANGHYTSFNKHDMSGQGTDFTGDGSGGMGGDTYGSSSIWNDPDLLAVRVEYRDIEPIKLLSRGGFGEVWLGLYMNENVAIKRLLGDKKTMSDALAFATEIKIMARLDHPKVVRFIGVAWTNALTIQAVTEFMDCGDLRSLLDSPRASSLTWANLKCQIAIDVADALVYLHTLNPKLIHRDLKSRNVLIDANAGAKLSDFGISRNRSVEETMTAGVGTARWIAPEVILGGHYTEFADIYSFGVVLSELDTCKTPFYDAVNTNGAKMPDVTILQLVSAGKLQPSFGAESPEPIVKLARACLAFDPAQRPSAIHISYELRKILKDELQY